MKGKIDGKKSAFYIAGIFIAGLVIGGLFSGSFTGRASNINSLSAAKTSIFIQPAKANARSILSITVDSRQGGGSPALYIRDDKGNRKDKILWCRGVDDFGNPVVTSGQDDDSTCLSRVTFEYRLLTSYNPGIYYMEVYDESSGQDARAYFEVIKGGENE